MRPSSLKTLLVMGLLPFVAAACSYYSFSGATIPAHLSTIAIPLVQDNSVSTVNGLDEQITQLLLSRFVGQTRLSLDSTPDEADVVLTATIDRYVNQATSVSGDERATRNRVTISVTARYFDNTTGEELIDRVFSGFEEYDPLDPSLEEAAAIAALGKVADDIFTAATSNW
jgi:lipopolysaccharide assembly LptE-like protein